jgi:hypothetical protein
MSDILIMTIIWFLTIYLGIGNVLFAAIYSSFHLRSWIKYFLAWPYMIVVDYRLGHPGIIRRVSKWKKMWRYHTSEIKDHGRWLD